MRQQNINVPISYLKKNKKTRDLQDVSNIFHHKLVKISFAEL